MRYDARSRVWRAVKPQEKPKLSVRLELKQGKRPLEVERVFRDADDVNALIQAARVHLEKADGEGSDRAGE